LKFAQNGTLSNSKLFYQAPTNVYVSFDHIADGLTKIDTIAAKYEKDLQDAVTRVFSSRCTTCIKFF
jgi:hypothetical protein